MTAGEKIPDVRNLISLLDEKLISFLKSLKNSDWEKQTIAKLWKVKDVAAHLLDGNIRGISFGRDKLEIKNDTNINSYNELVDFLNDLNSVWIKASKRISTELLTELLNITNKEYYNYLTTLDLDSKAIFAVSWAGEEVSDNRFHIAREYTEKWIHQQQIRDTLGDKEIMSKEFFYPLMGILLRGLPNTFRNVTAENGTAVKINITGEDDYEWFLIRINENWILSKTNNSPLSSELTIKDDTAWKLFSKSLRYENIKNDVNIAGDKKLAENVLELVSVMA